MQTFGQGQEDKQGIAPIGMTRNNTQGHVRSQDTNQADDVLSPGMGRVASMD